MSALGYVDEVIRHIDSRKKVFQVLGLKKSECLRWVHVGANVVPSLIVAPKFTLPTLGQFYRPLSELQEREDGKFSLYAEGYEIDMLQYPPFNEFVLEFAGFDDNVRIVTKTQTDVLFSKYVVWCRVLHPNSISITPFYYSAAEVDVVPIGWVMNGITFTLKYSEPNDRIVSKSGKGFGIQFSVEEQHEWEGQREIITSMISGIFPEMRALFQFLVVMNIKNGITHSEAHTPRVMVARSGRRLGYRYHVLDIDPNYVAERRDIGGTHASPGFHIRRAHLRHFKNEQRFKKRFTLVHQHFVGSVLDGIVDKDYNVKDSK